MLLNGVSTQLLLTRKIELDNSAQLLVFTGSYAFMSLCEVCNREIFVFEIELLNRLISNFSTKHFFIQLLFCFVDESNKEESGDTQKSRNQEGEVCRLGNGTGVIFPVSNS